jgi:serine/threonine-protein phosphatase 5
METITIPSSSHNHNSQDSLESLEKSVYSIRLGDINYQDSLKIAEELKEAGNKLLNANKFADAIDKFTDAINLGIETNKNAIYYSNRAFCNIKLENFGLAIEDANKAIEIDKEYIKAYYRRASANLLLFHFDESVKDLEYLVSKLPADLGLEEKLQKAKVERKKKRFLESLKGDKVEEEYDISKFYIF